MRVVVAHRAVDLAHERHARHLVALALEPVHHVGHLLAERGGGGGLAVGAREHGLVGVLVGKLSQRHDQLVHLGQQYLASSVAHHERVGEIVDVLGGAGEMDELGDGLEFRVAGNLLLEEVLHRLHVVIGGALDILHPARVLLAEAGHDAVEHVDRMAAQGRHLGDRLVGRECLEPGHLHLHAIADQTEFAEHRAQCLGACAIAAVHR
jgi:hypothetical protein